MLMLRSRTCIIYLIVVCLSAKPILDVGQRGVVVRPKHDVISQHVDKLVLAVIVWVVGPLTGFLYAIPKAVC
jgi:hypothetical protein